TPPATPAAADATPSPAPSGVSQGCPARPGAVRPGTAACTPVPRRRVGRSCSPRSPRPGFADPVAVPVLHETMRGGAGTDRIDTTTIQGDICEQGTDLQARQRQVRTHDSRRVR